MSVQLEIGLESRPLERVSADLVGAGFFCDDRPLRGGPGRLDWRLCGLISERMAAGELTGAAGEVVSRGRMPQDVLFVEPVRRLPYRPMATGKTKNRDVWGRDARRRRQPTK